MPLEPVKLVIQALPLPMIKMAVRPEARFIAPDLIELFPQPVGFFPRQGT